MSDSIQRQGLRYIVTGVMNTTLGNVAYFVGVSLGLPHQLALVINYLVGGTNGYFWNRHWTFQATGSHLIRVPRFVLVLATVYATNALLLETLVRHYGLGPMPAQLGCIVVSTLMGFFGHRTFSFRKLPGGAEAP